MEGGLATNLKHKLPVRRQQSGRGLIRISEAVADVIDDPSLIEDWDDEELRRGRRKDRNGKFTGRDPLVVPTNCYREILRRETRKAQVSLSTGVDAAVDALTAIIQDPRSDAKAKVAASKIILDRVLGKVPDKIEVGGQQPVFLGILQGGIVPGDLSIETSAIEVDTESIDIEWEGNG